MSIREDRVLRRIKNFIKLPTDIMLADGLTKVKVCPVLQQYMESGWWHIPLVTPLKSNIVVQTSPEETIAEESQLTNLKD